MYSQGPSQKPPPDRGCDSRQDTRGGRAVAFRPGQQIGDHHRIIAEIGKGGMSTVYSAWDTRLEREDAIKVMRTQYADDPTFAARFKQEAQAAASLHSPHIVEIYDWNKDNGDYYIVMEKLDGADLKQIIERKGALDCKSVALVAAQVCSALSVAHANGIIHRDIKPNNIMIVQSGSVKVMDFGIAKSQNSNLTTDNSVWGTANYVSPEQVQAKALGPTSDIYSLGVVMYEAATGELPFKGEDAISVALQQINKEPVPPSQLVPSIPPVFEDIILRCMEKDPTLRYQSAADLRAALLAYVKGIAAPAPQEPTAVIDRPAESRGGIGVIDQGSIPSEEGPVLESAGNWFTRLPTGTKVAIAVIAGMLVLALGFGISYATGLFGFGASHAGQQDAAKVVVPQLIGETREAAERRLGDAKLTPKVEEVWDTEESKGKVIGQNPSAMKEVAEGSEVSLKVSKGKKPAEKVKVPSLIHKTAEEAERALTDAGLVADQQQAYSDSVEKGLVISQATDANSEVEVGSTVSYVVSLGSDLVTVPSVSGRTADAAHEALESKGFKVTESYVEDDGPEGVVRNYTPEGDQPRGTTITIYVTKKPAEVSIPNVTGSTEQGARSVLEASGFTVTSSTQEIAAGAGFPDGTVMSYSPSGSAQRGATVHIVIAKVREEEPQQQQADQGGASQGGSTQGGSQGDGSQGGGSQGQQQGGSTQGGATTP